MMQQTEHQLYPAGVLENTLITKGVYVLKITKAFDFIPGQVIGITTGKTIPPRLYSIASPPQAPFIQLLFDVKTEGLLTPLLENLKQGDEVLVTAPFGDFVDNEELSCWIATGTGIAPFYSMAKSGLIKNKMLIHGARTVEGFYFSEFFAEKLKGRYIQCCSTCNAEGIYSGRLTRYLQSISLPNTIQKYYLCGSAEMVVEVRDILLSKGIGFNSIHSEIYF